MNKSDQFQPPKETIVFKPTTEEFQNALKYIEKIRPEAEPYGICKLIPPKDWNPWFAADIDKIKFKPRIQRINELEARTRERLNYLRQVSKYWELKGYELEVPRVNGKALDLFQLKNCVKNEGGHERADWKKIAIQMGFSKRKEIAADVLKRHYLSIIHPFDTFQEETRHKEKTDHKNKKRKLSDSSNVEHWVNMLNENGISNSTKDEVIGNGFQGRIDEVDDESGIDTDDNRSSRGSSVSKELARLQFYGAGPKTTLATEKEEKTRGIKLNFGKHDPLESYVCASCNKKDAEDQLLLCDECDACCHTFCLVPPLSEVPKWVWSCQKCIAIQVSKPIKTLAFEHSERDYTLQSFGDMANNFKSRYFETEGSLVSTVDVEKEYWRILNDYEEDVTVVYGADEHTEDQRSGFPKKITKYSSDEDKLYVMSHWNLNNLSVLPDSILRYADTDISGMIVPWLYVGMCFSSFCWHVEDHWTLSINYLHMGEPKTWYGVPGKYASKLESVMKTYAPELFKAEPKLLHELITTLNPNILEQNGVPIFRTDQCAGEFVITWPRAYHAGFNQGFNVAEAVNFAPPCWLEIGRHCIENYASMSRKCVFSHDELVCKMAENSNSLSKAVAIATRQDMSIMIQTECILRKKLLKKGDIKIEREAFETLSDDERKCTLCNTTCFLSAFVVDKNIHKPFCLRHTEIIKNPNKVVLYYRYTINELVSLLDELSKSIEIRNQLDKDLEIDDSSELNQSI